MCSLVVIEIFKNGSIFGPQTLYLNNYYITRSNIIIDAKKGICKLIFRFLENIIKWLLSYLRLKFTFFDMFYTGGLGNLAVLVIKYIISNINCWYHPDTAIAIGSSSWFIRVFLSSSLPKEKGKG